MPQLRLRVRLTDCVSCPYHSLRPIYYTPLLLSQPEWFIANCGAIAAGGVAVGIYPTNGPEACRYITDHSEAQVVVVEDKKQLAKFISMADRLPKVKAFVM